MTSIFSACFIVDNRWAIIIEVLFGIADDWLTYRQANNYHSILIATETL